MSVAVHHRFDGPSDAPVLMLAASLGTTLELWDDSVPALAERMRVLRYDNRGHGRSPVPPGPYSIADLGEDALALLDRLGLERVSFCGLSIGGNTGMWLGAHAPERIDRLVLCCTAARLPPPEQWVERAALVRAEGTAAVAEAALERWFTPAFKERDRHAFEWMRQTLLAIAPEGYAACCEALAEADLRPELGAITAPTLVIGGKGDPVGTPAVVRGLQEAIAGARLVVIPEARHIAPVEQPQAFVDALLEHLGAEARA